MRHVWPVTWVWPPGRSEAVELGSTPGGLEATATTKASRVVEFDSTSSEPLGLEPRVGFSVNKTTIPTSCGLTSLVTASGSRVFLVKSLVQAVSSVSSRW